MKISVYPSMLQVVRITGEETVYRDLREYLSIPNPGAKYSKNHFASRTYFITEKQGLASIGFLPIILKWCDSSNVPVELLDCRGVLPVFNPDFDRTDAGITLRDYQEQAIVVGNNNLNGFPFPVGTLDLATNAGKTYVAWFLRKAYGDCNMLILIPSSSIFRQTVKEYKELFGDQVGVIYGTKMEWSPVIISSPKTIYNRMFEDGSITPKMWEDKGYKILAFDEMDLSTGSQFTQMLKKLPMPIRMGLSGTPRDHSDPKLVLRAVGNFGPTLMKVSKQDLINRGISQRPVVHIIYVPPVYADTYDDAMRVGIEDNPTRCHIIRTLLESRHKDENTLITCNHSVHAYNMYQNLKDLGDTEVTDSKDSSKNRKLDEFKEGKITRLISTMIVKRGLNLPKIRVVVQAQGGKSKSTLSQVSGRGERNDGVNESFTQYDFMDDSNFLRQHSLIRIGMYISEGFEVIFEYPAEPNGYPKLR